MVLDSQPFGSVDPIYLLYKRKTLFSGDVVAELLLINISN